MNSFKVIRVICNYIKLIHELLSYVIIIAIIMLYNFIIKCFIFNSSCMGRRFRNIYSAVHINFFLAIQFYKYYNFGFIFQKWNQHLSPGNNLKGESPGLKNSTWHN